MPAQPTQERLPAEPNTIPQQQLQEFSEEKAGDDIAAHIVGLAKDPNVPDKSLHGLLAADVNAYCASVKCDESQTEKVTLAAVTSSGTALAELDPNKREDVAIAGRILLAGSRPAMALDLFVTGKRTDHASALLVDLMSGGVSEEGDQFWIAMDDFVQRRRLRYSWVSVLNDLILIMEPGEAADVRYALRGYVASLRHWCEMTGNYPAWEEDIRRLENISLGKTPSGEIR